MLCFYSDDLDRDLVSGFQFPCCDYERDLGEGEQGVRCELLPVLQQDREDDLFGLEFGCRLSRLCREVFPGQADDFDFFRGWQVGEMPENLAPMRTRRSLAAMLAVDGRALARYQLMISAPAAPWRRRPGYRGRAARPGSARDGRHEPAGNRNDHSAVIPAGKSVQARSNKRAPQGDARTFSGGKHRACGLYQGRGSACCRRRSCT